MTDINLEVSKLKEEAVGILHRLHTAQILSNSPFSSSPDVDPHNESFLEVAAMLNATRGVSNPSYSLVEEEDTL